MVLIAICRKICTSEFCKYDQNRTKIAHTDILIKVVHEQSGKVEYQRERLLGISKKLINFHSDSQQPVALVFDFSALLGGQP
jgi:hypothetical protein